MKLQKLFFVLLCYQPFLGLAQNFIIKGTVRDAHTQEPISYASAYSKQTGIGVMTDSSGNFSFTLKNTSADTLVVSYVGFTLFTLPINPLADTIPLNIELKRGSNTEAVIVKNRFNKGLFLWRKIMSKKEKYNRYNLTNFSYQVYNKIQVDIKNFAIAKVKNNILLKPFSFIIQPLTAVVDTSGALPAYLIENVSNYGYQQSPKKYYENILASNTRGLINESVSQLLGVMKQNVNVYSNFINVVGKDFISPFNDNANNYYSFYVPDTQTVNGNKILHFVFKPKYTGQNTFEGDAWITAGTFFIKKITLYLGKQVNINYLDRISIFQEFEPINDSLVFLSRDKFFADFRLLGKKSLTLTGKKTASYKNIIINSDAVANLFKNQGVTELLVTDTGFTKKSDTDWSALRHDSLSVNEKTIYTTIDNLISNPKYLSLQNNFKFLGSGYKNVGSVEVGKWFSIISGNQWEGLRFKLDVGTNKKFNKNIYLHTYLAYGTKDKKYKGQAEAYWIIKRKPNWLRLHFNFNNDIDVGIPQYGQADADNIFALAIRKPNSTRKFLQVKTLRFEIFKEWGAGFSTELFAGQQQFTPLQNLPLKNTFTVSTGQVLNNFEVAVKLRFAYLEQFIIGDFFKYSTGNKYPIIELVFAKGIPGFLNSAYDYTKYNVAVSDAIKVSPYGLVKYKIYAGKINGSLPFTFLENHPGNDLYYFNNSAFNLMYRFEYLSDKYAGINMEHNIGSGLFRFLPITRKLKWRQFWNVKSLWGSLSNTNIAINNSTTFFKTLNRKTYMELGTGIDNIFKIFRLDFVWRLLPTPLPVNKISKFGIFGSLQFKL